MTKGNAAQRPGDKADGKTGKGQKGPEQRIIGCRKEQGAEDQRRRRTVKKKSYHSRELPRKEPIINLRIDWGVLTGVSLAVPDITSTPVQVKRGRRRADAMMQPEAYEGGIMR
jgi:hypothetical protein